MAALFFFASHVTARVTGFRVLGTPPSLRPISSTRRRSRRKMCRWRRRAVLPHQTAKPRPHRTPTTQFGWMGPAEHLHTVLDEQRVVFERGVLRLVRGRKGFRFCRYDFVKSFKTLGVKKQRQPQTGQPDHRALKAREPSWAKLRLDPSRPAIPDIGDVQNQLGVVQDSLRSIRARHHRPSQKGSQSSAQRDPDRLGQPAQRQP